MENLNMDLFLSELGLNNNLADVIKIHYTQSKNSENGSSK